jgi:hypothetical protein
MVKTMCLYRTFVPTGVPGPWSLESPTPWSPRPPGTPLSEGLHHVLNPIVRGLASVSCGLSTVSHNTTIILRTAIHTFLGAPVLLGLHEGSGVTLLGPLGFSGALALLESRDRNNRLLVTGFIATYRLNKGLY